MTRTKKRSRFLAFLKWTGISVAALAGLALVLNLTTGMHLQISGGLMPQLDFHHEGRHYQAIEAHRERSVDIAPAGGPAPLETVAEETGDNAVPEAEPSETPEPRVATAAPSPGSWPYYRGLHMDGRYLQPINTAWPNEGPPELWRVPVGGGYASFVVGDGLAYTIEQRREQEVVAAYDLLTGVERWSASWDARFEESMGGDGPRATPALYEGTLVALGATGYVYGLDDGILACVDAETGDRMWKGGRYGHGQVLLASGHLLITTERGQLVLVRATPESHQEVAALPAVSGRTWNNPAIAEGILLVRNDRQAVAFDIRPQT